jgi:hypothetical protein
MDSIKHKIWFLILPIVPLVAFVPNPFGARTCACVPAHKALVGTVVALQEAYFRENQVFLGEGDGNLRGLLKPTAHFDVTMETVNDGVVVYATLRREVASDLLGLGLTKHFMPNLVAAVVSTGGMPPRMLKIVCEGESNSLSKPAVPRLTAGALVCPTGYRPR